MMQPKVSVCMITYGHEKYIRAAVEGVLLQICDFEFELILVNDCSPDKTDEIIKDILENHPLSSKIHYSIHENNIGMMPNFAFAIKKCKREYIALCDGDDYWTDPLKLQKQVDFLEGNLDYVLCFHQVKILKASNELVNDFITKIPEQYEEQETLARLGNYIHTPSVVYRNILEYYPPEFYLSPIGDYFLYLLLSEHGKLKYLEEKMAVYRYGVGVHSSYDQIKLARANLKLFTLLLSYSSTPKINIILLERHFDAVAYFEKTVKISYETAFVSNHVFFKALKSLKKPTIFWKKLKQKLLK